MTKSSREAGTHFPFSSLPPSLSLSLSLSTSLVVFFQNERSDGSRCRYTHLSASSSPRVFSTSGSVRPLLREDTPRLDRKVVDWHRRPAAFFSRRRSINLRTGGVSAMTGIRTSHFHQERPLLHATEIARTPLHHLIPRAISEGKGLALLEDTHFGATDRPIAGTQI